MESPNTWFSLYPSGKKFDVLNPRIQDIHIEDIARSLSMKVRFNGFIRDFYSVAEHCCIMYDIVDISDPDLFGLKKNILFHDAAEAYLTDVPAPVKPTMANFIKIENEILALIYYKFKVPKIIDIQYKLLKQLDRDICVTEAFYLGLNINVWPEYQNGNAHLLPDTQIHCWPWQQAEDEFLARYEKVK